MFIQSDKDTWQMRTCGLVVYIKQSWGFQQDARVKINLGLSMLKRYQGVEDRGKTYYVFYGLNFSKTRRCRNALGISYW
jgi:hypothetical protein